MLFRVFFVLFIIAVVFGLAHHVSDEWPFYGQLFSYLVAVLVYAGVVGIVRTYCDDGEGVRPYIEIEAVSSRIKRFFNLPRSMLVSVVIFFIGLALDPMNPFKAFFLPMVEGAMPYRPAMIGGHAVLICFFLPWLLWGLDDAITFTIDTIKGRMSAQDR